MLHQVGVSFDLIFLNSIDKERLSTNWYMLVCKHESSLPVYLFIPYVFKKDTQSTFPVSQSIFKRFIKGVDFQDKFGSAVNKEE